MTKTPQKRSEPLSRQSLRSALRRWNNSRELSEHPLAQLDVVEVQRKSAGYADTPTGQGVALRDVLHDALETLRPEAGEPNFLAKRWRPYLIVKEQYIAGRFPDYLAEQLGIARSTYNHEQARALDTLSDVLCQWEQDCGVARPAAANSSPQSQKYQPFDARQSPFLAPPRPAHDLVGRESLLRTLKQRLLVNGSLALSALNGLPGVGKTALAIELAHDPKILAHFQDGVLWASLGRRPDLLALLGAWGAALGIPSSVIAGLPNPEERARIIHAAIGMRRMLLVVDDAWQAEAALAFKLGGPNCAHLVTTRIPETALEFAGEGMAVVRELDEADGLALLTQLAPKATQARLNEARALVQAVGGLPLALILMGRYLRKETLCSQPRRMHKALEQLQQAKTRLHLAQPQALLERHPDLPADAPLSLLTAIGLSDRALDAMARHTLRALAVFGPKPNSFSEQAALAVSAAPAETLDTLTDHGLLESAGPGRYTLHQTIADYARTKLADESVYERLAKHFVHYAETHRLEYDTLDLEANNVLAALQVAFDRKMPALLVRGVNAFYPFLEVRGLYALAERLLNQAQQAARAASDADGLATALRNLGRIVRNRGDYVQAEAYLLEGLALAREMGDLEKISLLLADLGGVAGRRGDYARAEVYLMEGLSLAREIGDRENVSVLLMNLGAVADNLGDYAQAESFYQQSLSLAREIGNRERISILLQCLGSVAGKRGDLSRAEAFYQAGLALAREIGHRQRISALLQGLGSAADDCGDYARAEALYREGLALAREIGDRLRVSALLASLGKVVSKQGDDAQAEAYLQEGLALAREIGHRERTSALLASLGAVASKRGDDARAETYLQEGLALARKIGHRENVSVLLMNLGALAVRREDYGRAETCYWEGLALAREIGNPWLISRILGEWGELGLRQQQLDAASDAFREALRVAQESRLQARAGLALYGLARVAAAQGNEDAAHRQGQESLTLLETIGHCQAAQVARWLDTLLVADLS